jgi:carboxypeptidase T
MPYLAASGFNLILGYLTNYFPTISKLITLPEKSHQGRTIQGMRIGKPGTNPKRTILLFGGCHARELINPDLLLSFATELLSAYTKNTNLVFGSVFYDASVVQLMVKAIDIIVIPLINPDGRNRAQTTSPWWRGNLNPNPGETCPGVDINRNYDLLWSSDIGSSTYSCHEVYKGKSAFSEPETRNVRWLLDTYPTIDAMVDVHSYSELVLYPWGDDETQTTDPNMNFMNPAFNGQRGIGGDVYKEYMRSEDRDLFVDAGYRVRDVIHKVRGHCYTVKTGFNLYPTSGTSNDYAYSRHIVDPSKRKIFAYVLETGQQHQPPVAEALEVIKEVSAGLFEFCLAFCCPIVSGKPKSVNCGVGVSVADLLGDSSIVKTPSGRLYKGFITDYFMEVRELLETNRSLYTAAVRLVRYIEQIARLHFADPPGILDARLIHNLDRTLASFGKTRGLSNEFKKAVATVRKDLPYFEGKTLAEGLKLVSDNGQHSRNNPEKST